MLNWFGRMMAVPFGFFPAAADNPRGVYQLGGTPHIRYRVSELSKAIQIDQETLDTCKVVHATWNEITRTWTLPTVHALGLKEPARFNELKRRIQGISATSLAERLTQLEKSGVIQRKVFPESPPKVEYSLTAKGHEVYKILCDLAKWSERWGRVESRSSELPVPE